MTVNGRAYRRQLWAPATSVIGGGALRSPTAQDTRRRGKNSSQRGLSNTEDWLPTPTARDHKDCGSNWDFDKAADKKRLAGVVNQECQSRTGDALYLNPSFVEEMMGFPVGHTVLEP